MSAVTREQALAFRLLRHGLADGATTSGDLDLLDYGIQDTGSGGAAWAVTVRGRELESLGPVALAWTIRGAPHVYRRGDLDAIAVATAPFSEEDASKRIYDAAKPLRAAGIAILDGLRRVADSLRAAAASPVAKGDASGALGEVLPRPFLRDCRPCGTTHIFEMPFRLAALQAGLELEADTSPPVLRKIPRLRPRLFSRPGHEAAPRFHVVRGYLRFYGPARPADVAGYLDAPVKEVTAHWPHDTVEVDVDGQRRWILESDADALAAAAAAVADRSTAGVVRLLGPFDPYLQLRDRELLVPDDRRRKQLWPVLGRPGAVLVGGEIAGTWRPRQSGKKLTVEVERWTKLGRPQQAAVEEQAERLAAFRGASLAGISFTGG